MTAHNKLNELNRAEDSARRLLERLEWIYVPREALAAVDKLSYESCISAGRQIGWGWTRQLRKVPFCTSRVEGVGQLRNEARKPSISTGGMIPAVGVRDSKEASQKAQELQLTKLLDDPMDDRGHVGAAEALGVNYRTLMMSPDSGRLTRRMLEEMAQAGVVTGSTQAEDRRAGTAC